MTTTYTIDRIEPNLSFPDCVIVSFLCPRCGDRHYHGMGRDELGQTQHRVAHCAGEQHLSGYYIRTAKESAD